MISNENIFDEVQNVRNTVMEKILQNQNILKLVAIPSPDALSQNDIENVGALIDNYIWFKPKVFEATVKDVKCFLLMDINVTATRNRSNYSDIKIIFRVIVHNDLFELDNGKARSYEIAKHLTDMFQSEKGSWIGKCEFLSCYQLETPFAYQGIEVAFSVTDFKG